MTRKSVGVLALVGMGIGILGSWATGCDLGSGGTIGIDPDSQDTVDTKEQIVPAPQGELSNSDFLEQLDSDG